MVSCGSPVIALQLKVLYGRPWLPYDLIYVISLCYSIVWFSHDLHMIAFVCVVIRSHGVFIRLSCGFGLCFYGILRLACDLRPGMYCCVSLCIMLLSYGLIMVVL